MTKIAIAQMQMDSDMQKNYNNSISYIKEAAKANAKLIVFPEGQLSYYIPQYENLCCDNYAIELNHPYIKGFQASCRKNNIIASIAICLKANNKVYASNIIISEKGEILGIGKKNHIVRTSHFYEQDYFSPGEDGFQVVDTSIGKIGMIVCFDRHYPESYRACINKGADLIVVPVANEIIEPLEIFAWEIRIAAFQNSVNLIMANRVGIEGNMNFCGESIIVNPDGTLNQKADNHEQLLLGDIDMCSPPIIRQEKQYLSLLRPEIFK